MQKILIIEDEKDIAEAIEYNLLKEDFKVYKAVDGVTGLRQAREKIPDLIILDLMLPQLPGMDVLRSLKKDAATSSIPIIILTAKGEETDKVIGLEMGADDYITKPFGMRELIARIKSNLRRSSVKETNSVTLKFPDLVIDIEKHSVKAEGKTVELTAKEFALLQFLASNPDKVFSREKLLDTVWGIDVAIETRTVDVHIRRLRQNLGKAGRHIQTLRGVGYKFC